MPQQIPTLRQQNKNKPDKKKNWKNKGPDKLFGFIFQVHESAGNVNGFHYCEKHKQNRHGHFR